MEEKFKKNSKPKYSIITPMYNSFHLMERYFNSFSNQTFKDFELIIVDDASTDDSYKNVIEFAENSDLTISVLKSEKNSGPGNARNIGMEVASGQWITFVDNDDWVETNFLELIDNILLKNNVNCVVFDYYTTDGNNKKSSKSMYHGKQGKVELRECIKYVRNHSVGKIYNLDKCRKANIKYPEVRRCEDVAFVARALDACGTVYYFNRPLYYYFQRSASLSNNTMLDHKDMIKAFDILEKELSNKYLDELAEKSVTDILYGSLLMMCKSSKSNKEICDYINNYETKYPNWYNYQIKNYLGKSKKIFLILAKHRMIFGLKILSLIHSKLVG